VQERQINTRRNSNSSTTLTHTSRGRSRGKGGRRGDEGRYDKELHGLALLWLELLLGFGGVGTVAIAPTGKVRAFDESRRFLAKQATFGLAELKKMEPVPRVSFTT
jgi:hypothetical protein